MIEVLIAAPGSGSGKTIVTCALLAALQRRGYRPCAFKCGPDYIDPMFHRAVLGVESRNLDLFLADETAVQTLYAQTCAGHGAAIIEAAMGFYDGLGGSTDRASGWQVADTLDLPVLLVVRPRGTSLTLAAQIRGLQAFRQPSRIAGLLLNDCSPALADRLLPLLERETGLPVVGCLPHLEEAALAHRHLGLYTAGEVDDLSVRLDRIARQLDQNLDWDRFFARFGQRADRPRGLPRQGCKREVPIAVARDDAFCFTYPETLETLEAAGAELRFFSPLRDPCLPDRACGLYLPGGYPELYASRLAENTEMRTAVRKAVQGGIPTVAECGGFLYLGRTLQGADGLCYPMAGCLPGDAVRTDHLVRFGYAELAADRDSLLFRAGERVPVHEFHYWDSSETGGDLTAHKPLTGRTWRCGFAGATLYAAFPHLYFAGRPALARRFVQAAEVYAHHKEAEC